MATNKIDIILSAKDQTTEPINKIGKNVGSFAKKVQTDFVSIAAKVFIVQQAYRALSNVIGGLINAANRQEDAVNRLNNAMRIQGSFTDELSQKYRDFAKEMQRSTRFGDEAIMELMQQLIAVGNVSEAQMFRASRAAMDFATATGRDLNTAALTVGKAMGGFTGELSRYGIIIDQNIPKTEKAEAALKAMEKQFGTAAQMDVNTFSGSVAQLSNSWSDFQEVLGEWITTSKDTKGIIAILNTAVTYWTDAMAKSNQATVAQSGLLGDLNAKLLIVNEALDANLKKQAAPFLLNRNEIEHQYNLMLERRSEILLTIARVAKEEIEPAMKLASESAEKIAPKLTEDMKRIALQSKVMASTMEAGFTNALSSLIRGVGSAKEVFQELGTTMVKAVVDFVAQQIIAATIGKVIRAGETALLSAMGATVAAAWAPAAAMTSLASFGSNAGPAAAGIASVAALTQSLAIPKMAEGGIISATPGGRLILAGEAGSDEAIIPLNKSGAFGDINIFIQGGINPGGSSIDEMAEQLGFAFEREVRTARG